MESISLARTAVRAQGPDLALPAQSIRGTGSRAGCPDHLELFIEPNDGTMIENADSLTLAPWGDLIICEDGDGDDHLIGVTPAGAIYKLARNQSGTGELAGACFSPDGTTLFVNAQFRGLTLAITGPWHRQS